MFIKSNFRKPRFFIFNLLFLISATTALHAGNGPRWWAERSAIDPAKTANDYAAANQGQLKFMAMKAEAELDAKLPGGAGTEIKTMLDQWSTVQNGVRVPKVNANSNDYAPLTIGQLKYVGKKYYDRLTEAGIIANGKYPWKKNEGADPMNMAVANLGQLKTIFSFIAYIPGPDEDSDGDGLPDLWELQQFGNLGRHGDEVLTPGGLRMRDVYQFGLDYNNLDDGTASGASPVSGADIFVYDSRGWLKEATLINSPKRTFVQDAEGNISNVR